MEIEIVRMIERILIVFGGILSIFFGYRLFSIVGQKVEGNASLKLHLLTASMSKVGPGVFFALFGAYILWSAEMPIKRDTMNARYSAEMSTANTVSALANVGGSEQSFTKNIPGLGTEKLEEIQSIVENMPEGKDKKALLKILNSAGKDTNEYGSGNVMPPGITHIEKSGFSGSSLSPPEYSSQTGAGGYSGQDTDGERDVDMKFGPSKPQTNGENQIDGSASETLIDAR